MALYIKKRRLSFRWFNRKCTDYIRAIKENVRKFIKLFEQFRFIFQWPYWCRSFFMNFSSKKRSLLPFFNIFILYEMDNEKIYNHIQFLFCVVPKLLHWTIADLISYSLERCSLFREMIFYFFIYSWSEFNSVRLTLFILGD